MSVSCEDVRNSSDSERLEFWGLHPVFRNYSGIHVGRYIEKSRDDTSQGKVTQSNDQVRIAKIHHIIGIEDPVYARCKERRSVSYATRRPCLDGWCHGIRWQMNPCVRLPESGIKSLDPRPYDEMRTVGRRPAFHLRLLRVQEPDFEASLHQKIGQEWSTSSVITGHFVYRYWG